MENHVFFTWFSTLTLSEILQVYNFIGIATTAGGGLKGERTWPTSCKRIIIWGRISKPTTGHSYIERGQQPISRAAEAHGASTGHSPCYIHGVFGAVHVAPSIGAVGQLPRGPLVGPVSCACVTRRVATKTMRRSKYFFSCGRWNLMCCYRMRSSLSVMVEFCNYIDTFSRFCSHHRALRPSGQNCRIHKKLRGLTECWKN